MTEKAAFFCIGIPLVMLCNSLVVTFAFARSYFGLAAILLWLVVSIISFIAGVMPVKADPLVPEDDYAWIPDRIDLEEEWLK